MKVYLVVGEPLDYDAMRIIDEVFASPTEAKALADKKNEEDQRTFGGIGWNEWVVLTKEVK